MRVPPRLTGARTRISRAFSALQAGWGQGQSSSQTLQSSPLLGILRVCRKTESLLRSTQGAAGLTMRVHGNLVQTETKVSASWSSRVPWAGERPGQAGVLSLAAPVTPRCGACPALFQGTRDLAAGYL